MDIPYTIGQFINKNQTKEATGAFTSVLEDIGLACSIISSELRSAATTDFLKGAHSNSSGDSQVAMDIRANNIFLSLAQNNGNICGVASEEMDVVHYFTGREHAPYILVIDPLDGSDNLEINAPVATIFSLCHRPSELTENAVLESARKPLAAGICIYGLTTFMALTVGSGVHGFSRDMSSGTFLYTHEDLKIKNQAPDVAINYSNRNYWNDSIRRYVDDCFQGETGPRARYFNTRWYASAAAELGRILHRGGIFLYPACGPKKPHGVLRKLYEAWPMTFICEQAGGMATDGKSRMLEVSAKSLHERTPFVMGSSEEVSIVQKYHL